VRACDVHNIACATNLASAHLVLSQLMAAQDQPTKG
jgi:methylglyoxal synthase